MKVGWGQGRVEVIAARDEILTALSKGSSIKSLYAELKAAKRASLSYDGFYRHVRKLRDSPRKRPATPRGQSRMEVIKLRSQIMAGRAQGRTLKAIYEEFKAEGRISGSYIGFYKNVKKFCGSDSPRTSSPLPAAPSPEPAASNEKSPPPPARSPTSQAASRQPTPFPTEGRDLTGTPPEKRPRREPIFKRSTLTEEEIYGCRR
jgi:hypothetical protein